MRLTKKDYLEYYENSEIFHSLMDEMGLNKKSVLNEQFETKFENLLIEINKTLASPNYLDHVLILINELCIKSTSTDEELFEALKSKVEELALLHGSTKAISKILMTEQQALLEDSSNDGNTIFKRKAKIQSYSRAEQTIISRFLNSQHIKNPETNHFCFKDHHTLRDNTIYTRLLNYISKFKNNEGALFSMNLSSEKFWSYAKKECFLMLQVFPFTDSDNILCRLYEPMEQKFTTDKFEVIFKYLLTKYLKEKEYANWQFTQYRKDATN